MTLALPPLGVSPVRANLGEALKEVIDPIDRLQKSLGDQPRHRDDSEPSHSIPEAMELIKGTNERIDSTNERIGRLEDQIGTLNEQMSKLVEALAIYTRTRTT